MTTNEREIAIREGHKIHAETSYFTPRPQLDFENARYVFCEGFDRGYIAATTEANKRIKELDSEVAELKANSERLRKAAEKLVAVMVDALPRFDIIEQGRALDQLMKVMYDTPAESLAKRDDEVLERAEKAADSARWAGTDVVLAIRALKEVTK